MKKTIILIFISLLILLPCCACKSAELGKTLDSFGAGYTACLEAKDFAGLYDRFWSRSSMLSKDEFTAEYEAVAANLGIEHISVSGASFAAGEDSTRFNYTVTYTLADHDPISFTCSLLVIEEEGYSFDYDPSIVLPGYEDGYIARLVPVAGKRGEIFTADGELIAANSYAETVYFEVTEESNIETLLASLKTLFGEDDDIDEAAIRKRWQSALDNKYAVCAALTKSRGTLSEKQKKAIGETPGIGYDDTSMTPQRYYPYGSIFCHITGYTGVPDESEQAALAEKGFADAAITGKAGLEKTYNDTLQEQNGYAVRIYMADGQLAGTVYEKAAVDGSDLILSVNAETQQRSYYQMASELTEGQTGVAIVMDAKTGEVSALSAFPSYDPNLFTGGISEADYQALISEENGQPLFCRATQGLYPPGSLFKPFTITPVLEKGILKASTIFPFEVKDNKWKPTDEAWPWAAVSRDKEPEGPLDLAMAMRHSDNIYFAWAALQLGEEDFLAYLQKIGIGEAVPFDISVATSNLMNKDTEMDRKLLSDMAFGQGELLVTPVQIATMYTCFQNDGDMVAPRLVKAVKRMEDNAYTTVSEKEREVYKAGVMSRDTIKTLVPTLQEVVESGTASQIKTEGLSLAAKTGTALKGKDKTEKSSWIVAWWQGMDEDESRLALVLIDGPRESADSKQHIAKALLRP